MVTMTLILDDALDAELSELCAGLGKSQNDLVVELIQQRVNRERARKHLEDPAVIAETERLRAAGLLEVDPHEYDDLVKEATRP